jgi:hypothetical protein
LPAPEETSLIFLAFLIPPAIYFFVLGLRNRRRHPILRSGITDFAGVLFAASGFLVLGGPLILERIYERVRILQLLGRAGWLEGVADSWYFWVSLWVLYWVAVFGGAYYLAWRRRHQTSIYNLRSERLEPLLCHILGRLELGWLRADDGRILIGTRAAGNSEGLPRASDVLLAENPLTGGQATPASEQLQAAQTLIAGKAVFQSTAGVRIDSFPALRHLTLHWCGACDRVRPAVEAELADAFTVIPADDNPASLWFLSLSLGLFLLVSLLLVLLIVRALRPFW